MPESMEQLWSSAHISGGSAAYVEELYDTYLHDPSSIAQDWRDYFDQLPRINQAHAHDTPHSVIREQFRLLAKTKTHPAVVTPAYEPSLAHEEKQIHVLQLMHKYRSRGHVKAKTDPLDLQKKPAPDYLDLHYHGLTPGELGTVFQCGDLFFGKETATLQDIIADLEATYCGSIGAEITHISDSEEVKWLQQRLESARSKPQYSHSIKKVFCSACPLPKA